MFTKSGKRQLSVAVLSDYFYAHFRLPLAGTSERSSHESDNLFLFAATRPRPSDFDLNLIYFQIQKIGGNQYVREQAI